MKNRKYYESQSKIIKALSHPTRLFIVEKLSEKDCCVQELTKLIGDDISTVSRHLLVLKNAGIISASKKGLNVIYHLEARCAMRFIKCIESISNGNSCNICEF